MTFRLTVDRPRWERSLASVVATTPGLVPVIKGNGYGFGARTAAQACTDLGLKTLAVGNVSEIASIRAVFDGEILVLEPLGSAPALASSSAPAPAPARVIRTVARVDVLRSLGDSVPVVLELDSPMHRHGVRLTELARLAPLLHRIPLAGVALHLPIGGDRRKATRSAVDAVAALRGAGVNPGLLWVSHLTPAEVALVQRRAPWLAVRRRIGTGLWLADRSAFAASGTVLDTHPVGRWDSVGYRQRRPGSGTLVVVSGGTAHGVGLHSAAARGRTFDLLRAAAAGAAHGAGLAPSPFHWRGRRLHWADSPHMQVSMLFLPEEVRPPAVGDRLPCNVRMTVTTFDETRFESIAAPAAPTIRLRDYTEVTDVAELTGGYS